MKTKEIEQTLITKRTQQKLYALYETTKENRSNNIIGGNK